MNYATPDNVINIKRYLLGKATENEQQQIEEQMFLQDEYFKLVESVEDELIEEYVAGLLVGEEKKRFERHFMATAERQRSVTQARLLRDHFLEQLAMENTAKAADANYRETSRVDWQSLFANRHYALACALALSVLLIVSLAALLLNQTTIQQEQLQNQTSAQIELQKKAKGLEAELLREQQRRHDLEKQLSGEQESSLERDKKLTGLKNATSIKQNENSEFNQNVASLKARNLNNKKQKSAEQSSTKVTNSKLSSRNFVNSKTINLDLIAGQTMSANGDIGLVKLTPKVDSLKLNLEIEQSNYQSYNAEIIAEDEKTVWEKNGLKTHGKKANQRVVIILPAKNLLQTNYKIVLKGIDADANQEQVGTYYFRIARQ